MPPDIHSSTSGVVSGLWTAHIDASAVPNPGRMSVGVALMAPDGQLHTLSQQIGWDGCNNEAEALAFIAAVELARRLGVQQLQVWTDSRILVEQLTDARARPIVRLAPVYAQAHLAMAAMPGLKLGWIPRHRNTQADSLARAALDLV